MCGWTGEADGETGYLIEGVGVVFGFLISRRILSVISSSFWSLILLSFWYCALFSLVYILWH